MNTDFFIVIISVSLIRKYLETKTTQPRWDKYLRGVQLYSVFLFLATAALEKKQFWTFELIWNCVLLSLIYFLYDYRSNRIARILLIGGLPLVLVNISSDFFAFWTPHFYKINDSFFEYASGLSFLWLLAFWFGANSQRKSLLKERKEREAEELRNKLVVNELEVKVAERTAEITRQKEELEKTLSELRATQAQLIQSEKLASLGELTAGIAHEIQNPLNFVNNFAELSVELIEELVQAQAPQPPEGGIIAPPLGAGGLGLDWEILSDLKLNLEKINFHGNRASSIVKGMLEHSRASTGVKELTDINKLADEYLRLSYHGLRAKDKSFNANYELIADPNLPNINVISQDIGRVLLNLINNAFQSSPPAPRGGSPLTATAARPRGGTTFVKKVTVRTFYIEPTEKAPSGGLGASVSDNGAGIAAEVLPKIFQPFFTTKPTGQGTGLGLSLTYDIVTKGHGGTIEVESTPGQETTFTVRLPL